MIALDNLPVEFHAEYALAYEVRALHDAASLRPQDYRAGNAADWLVARLAPDAGSGSAVVPGAHLNTTDGSLSLPPGATMATIKRGHWQRLAAADPGAPTEGSYAWLDADEGRPRGLTPEALYSPFAYGGVVVFLYQGRASGADAFVATRLLYPEWSAHLGAALAGAEAFRPGGQPLPPAEAAALQVLMRSDNPLLAALAVRHAIEHGATSAAQQQGLWRISDARRLALLVYLALMAPAEGMGDWQAALGELVAATTDTTRLLALAQAAFSAGLWAGASTSAAARTRWLMVQVQRRSQALAASQPLPAQLSLILQKSGLP